MKCVKRSGWEHVPKKTKARIKGKNKVTDSTNSMLNDLNDVTRQGVERERKRKFDAHFSVRTFPSHPSYPIPFYQFTSILMGDFFPRFATTSRFTNISQSGGIGQRMMKEKTIPQLPCTHQSRMLMRVFRNRNTNGLPEREILPTFPVARTWQAQTSPNPPFPSTRYIRNVLCVIG